MYTFVSVKINILNVFSPRVMMFCFVNFLFVQNNVWFDKVRHRIYLKYPMPKLSMMRGELKFKTSPFFIPITFAFFWPLC